jgi:hypothetical protein
MRTPAWYKEAVAAHGERVASGTEDVAAAARAMAELLTGHPEFLASIAGRDVTRWAEKHGQGDLLQDCLFPAIPVLMAVSPGVKARTEDMTAEQLDKAKVMLMTRTRNATKAARQQRRAFTDFYNAVYPLLTGETTVAGALARLAARDVA